MKKLAILFIAISMSITVFSYQCLAKTPKEYENELKNIKVTLSDTDTEQVQEWLLDYGSGYPDLADKILNLLKGKTPKGNTTVLDAIMGKYRIANGKPSHQYIPPPFDIEGIKKAYVKNWKERNASMWRSMKDDVKKDYKRAFDFITN